LNCLRDRAAVDARRIFVMTTLVKPSHKLTFRDRLSQLNFEQAAKLLGVEGKKLILKGSVRAEPASAGRNGADARGLPGCQLRHLGDPFLTPEMFTDPSRSRPSIARGGTRTPTPCGTRS
jgi:hypothetical protein